MDILKQFNTKERSTLKKYFDLKHKVFEDHIGYFTDIASHTFLLFGNIALLLIMGGVFFLKLPRPITFFLFITALCNVVLFSHNFLQYFLDLEKKKKRKK